MTSVSHIAETGKRVLTEASEKNVTFMAAGIAYNAFVSLAPMLLLLFFVVSVVGGGLEARIVDLAWTSLPRPIADVVAQIFLGESTVTGASLVGVVALVWGTLKIFRGLDTAFSEIYETTAENSFVDQLRDGAVVFVALVVAVVSIVGASSVFARFSDAVPFVGYLLPAGLVAGLVVAFLPMYYEFPDADVDWRNVLPGVVFAAVGWAALQALFQVYLTFKGGGSGSFFGGVIVVVTWLYFSGIVLLVGAVINAVVGGYATGTPGGVGTGATSWETEHEKSMTRDEFDDYLQGLRARTTGRYETSSSTLAPDDGRETREMRPEGAVEVKEHTVHADDEEELVVRCEWRTEASGADASREAGSD
ncbi:YihY/virulence factor BrkB family protein [Halogeometricum luteum]|uniref:YihY/virulence factor BrkB family protein n=1 Tax=Halogeometricum luteum TaxID=2950537 RepID=A0ABU2G0J4_9EURY|nr:YihY/virulence factor BrkB family protein [Halogeometricum sp. S3BR5-2]MDS0294318.1 YihY/virulence factor BrkB family protein [Halogeometricum sp. S3BR5-2]